MCFPLILLMGAFSIACERSSQKSEEEMSEALSEKQEQQNQFYSELAAINQQINEINTDRVIYLNAGQSEIRRELGDDGAITKDKITRIRKLIDMQNQELQDYQNEIQALKARLETLKTNPTVNLQPARKLVESLLDQLNAKDEMLHKLQAENVNLQMNTAQLKGSIVELKDLLALANAENNKRYCVLFSKREVQLKEFTGAFLALPYREKQLSLLSIHPSGSFTVQEASDAKSTSLKISGEFWKDTKFAIIRVNRRDL